MIYRALPWVLVAAFMGAAGGCQFHPRPIDVVDPPTPPVSLLPYHVSDMRVQTVPATAFRYSTTRAPFGNLSDPVAHAIDALQDAMESGEIPESGKVLIIYHDPTENPATLVDVEIGVPVSANAPPTEEFQVRTLRSFRCATMVYRGPLNLLRRAYEKLIPDMIAAGYVPSDQTRESYMAWEGPDSPNNVVEIQVGIR